MFVLRLCLALWISPTFSTARTRNIHIILRYLPIYTYLRRAMASWADRLCSIRFELVQVTYEMAQIQCQSRSRNAQCAWLDKSVLLAYQLFLHAVDICPNTCVMLGYFSIVQALQLGLGRFDSMRSFYTACIKGQRYYAVLFPYFYCNLLFKKKQRLSQAQSRMWRTWLNGQRCNPYVELTKIIGN